MAARTRTAPQAKVQSKLGTFEIGYWVALTLKADSAPLRCYVGQVQAVDAHGIRITLIDWLIGMPTSWDFFAPWERITSALIATPEHDLEGFGEPAGEWQKQCGSLGKAEEPDEPPQDEQPRKKYKVKTMQELLDTEEQE